MDTLRLSQHLPGDEPGVPAVARTRGYLTRLLDWMVPEGCLFIYVTVEVTQIGEPVIALGLPSPWLATTGLAMLGIIIGVVDGSVRLRWSWQFAAVGLFVWSRCLSAVFAVDPTASGDAVVQLLKDTLTVFIVVTLAVACGVRLWRIAIPMSVALAALAGLAVLQQWVIGTDNDFFGFSTLKAYVDIGSVTQRFQGPLDDPNFWGRVLVVILPFAVAVLMMSRRWWRAVGAAMSASIVLGVFLTQSRGAFLAAAVAVVAFAILAGPKVRRYLIAVPVVGAILLLNPATGPRLATLVDLTNDAEEVVDLSLVYRQAAQAAGLAMFNDYPVTGVGIGNFNQQVPGYLRSGAAVLPAGAVVGEIAPHNSYIEMAAEGGTIGLSAYLTMVAAALGLGVAGLRRANRTSDEVADIVRFRHFTAATLAAVAAWSFMSLSLHLNQQRTLFVLLALAASTPLIARELPRRRAPVRMPRLMRVTEDAFAIGAATLLSGLLLIIIPAGAPTYTATSRSIVVVDTDDSTRAIYLLSYVGRAFEFRRTLVEIVEQPSVVEQVARELAANSHEATIDAYARRYTLVVEFRAASPSLRSATDGAERFRDAGGVAVAELREPFQLHSLGRTTVQRKVASRGLVDLAIVGLPIVMLLWRVTNAARSRKMFKRQYESYVEQLKRQYGAT